MPQLKLTKRLIFAPFCESLPKNQKILRTYIVAIFVSNISYKRHFWSYSSIIKFKYLNNLVVNILQFLNHGNWVRTFINFYEIDFKLMSISKIDSDRPFFLQFKTNFFNLQWLAAKDEGERCHLIRIYFGTHCKLV